MIWIPGAKLFLELLRTSRDDIYNGSYYKIIYQIWDIIVSRCGLNFETTDSRQYKLVRQATLDISNTCKSRTLQGIKPHVNACIEEDEYLKELENSELMRQYFKIFNLVNVGEVW